MGSNWIRAHEVTMPKTLDEANRALDLCNVKIADLNREIARAADTTILERVHASWVARRAEVDYAMARLQAGDDPTTKKDDGRVYFIHGRACATVAALDELIAAGVTLTPMAADLREQCLRNLPEGFRDKWTVDVLPRIHERLGTAT